MKLPDTEGWDGVEPILPPSVLYHATKPINLSAIAREGIRSRSGTSSFGSNQIGVSTTTAMRVVSGGSFGNLILQIKTAGLSRLSFFEHQDPSVAAEDEIRVVAMGKRETVIPYSHVTALYFIAPRLARYELKEIVPIADGRDIFTIWHSKVTPVEIPKTAAMRVAARFLAAKEWSSQQTLDAYLKEHPKANKTKHWVKGDRARPGKKDEPTKEAPESAAPEAPKTERKLAPKNRDPRPRERIQFDQSHVDAALSKGLDQGNRTHNILEAAGIDERYIKLCRDWTADWFGSSSRDLIERFQSSVTIKGSWANFKYSATQQVIESRKAALIRRGVMDEDGYLTLYRGVGPPQAKNITGDPAEIGVRGLSSWSENRDIAQVFAGYEGKGRVVKTKVHYSRIAACWEAESYGVENEQEWTVLIDKYRDSIECEIMPDRSEKYKPPSRIDKYPFKQAAEKAPVVYLDQANEDWIRTVRKRREAKS